MIQDQELSVNQIQKLALTPELRQSLAILQMSFNELESFINQQLIENFILEEISENDLDNEIEIPNMIEKSVASISVDDLDYQLDNHPLFEIHSSDVEVNAIENLTRQTLTLQEYLLVDLHLNHLTELELQIGEFLIGNLDDNGYLQIELTEVAKRFDTSITMADKILQLIQSFEPFGVGARNLTECLLLQLKYGRDILLQKFPGEVIDLAMIVVNNHLSDVAVGRFTKVTSHLGITLTELQAALDLICTLDPKPGSKFGGNKYNRIIVPDVTVVKTNNDYNILINEPSNTKVRINPAYLNLKTLGAIDRDTLQFIKTKQQQAIQLLKNIEQRKITLIKVVKALLKLQYDFFEHGSLFLKPLTLKEVAISTGLHGSTVSRAIAGKYLDTPSGVYPFKYFFSSSLNSVSGDDLAAKVIKERLRLMIDNEDLHAPLSDQRLVELFAEQGIKIARRTVAKYREELSIPGSNMRRRFKQ
jgi:RNA polymerase sigma-54 factor